MLATLTIWGCAMIHVVTEDNRSLYETQIREMHALRRKHFVEERGWTAMTVRDGGEYDAYDDAQSVYLLAIEADGAVSCSMRMRPTLTGSILNDVFPHLIAADEGSITEPHIWEISRYFSAGMMRGRGGAKRRAEIRMASLEVALDHKVRRLIGMTDIEFLPPLLNGSGWRVRPLGLPAPYAEGVALAIDVSVSRGALLDMADSQGLEGPIALRLDAARLPKLPPQEIESLVRLGASPRDQNRVIVALVKRVVDAQDTVEEEALLSMIDYVQTLVGRTPAASQLA